MAGERVKPQVSTNVVATLIEQAGAEDPSTVRLTVKENRKLSPDEVTELVEAYRQGAGQRTLARRYGVHRETVDRHLTRAGVVKRPVRVLTDAQEVDVVRLYVEEIWTLAELAAKFGVSQTAVRNVLVRRGVPRRRQARRPRG